MLLGRVHGHATSTLKHHSLRGTKMVLVQPIRSMTKEPLLVLDRLGVTAGDTVLITSDGRAARELVGDKTSPARWTTVGIIDDDRNVPTA